MQSIDLFRNMQIRDMNGVDPDVVREKHISLFADQDWRHVLEPLLGDAGLVERQKITEHVQTSEFEKRAAIAGYVAKKFSGRRETETPTEWNDITDLAYLAFILGRDTKKDGDLSSLVAAWEVAAKKWDLAGPIANLPKQWLLDLYCLYFEPENRFDYRRILSALRRISVCVSVYDPKIVAGALGPIDDVNEAGLQMRQRLLNSRILIPEETLPSHTQKPDPVANPPKEPRDVKKDKTPKNAVSGEKKAVKRTTKGAGRLKRKAV